MVPLPPYSWTLHGGGSAAVFMTMHRCEGKGLLVGTHCSTIHRSAASTVLAQAPLPCETVVFRTMSYFAYSPPPPLVQAPLPPHRGDTSASGGDPFFALTTMQTGVQSG